MHIEKYLTVILDHGAHFLKGCSSDGTFIAGSNCGAISIIKDMNIKAKFKVSQGLSGLSVHSERELIAVVTDNGAKLRIYNFAGTLLYEYSSPDESQIQECLFEPLSDNLLCVFRHSEVEIELASLAFEGDNQRLEILKRSSIFIEDSLVDSVCCLDFHKDAERITLFLGAGQDGQQTYWISVVPNIEAQLEPALTNSAMTAFSPSGNSFVVLDGDNRIVRFSFPVLKQLGVASNCGDEDDCFDIYYLYFDEETALVKTSNGRLVALNLTEMSVADAVVIMGLEQEELVSVTRLGGTVVLNYADEDAEGMFRARLICAPVHEFSLYK